jgi:uncharacterized protein (TIGR02588 family)
VTRRNQVEWAVLFISCLAVATVLGLLVYEGLSDTGRPPAPIVTLHAGEAYGTSTGWVLPATAHNDGDRSAQAVTLLATATVRGEEEEAEVTIDYLPAGTNVDLAFGFSGEPDAEVIVRVTGFLP